jgi:hypothetical protein
VGTLTGLRVLPRISSAPRPDANCSTTGCSARRDLRPAGHCGIVDPNLGAGASDAETRRLLAGELSRSSSARNGTSLASNALRTPTRLDNGLGRSAEPSAAEYGSHTRRSGQNLLCLSEGQLLACLGVRLVDQ